MFSYCFLILLSEVNIVVLTSLHLSDLVTLQIKIFTHKTYEDKLKLMINFFDND